MNLSPKHSGRIVIRLAAALLIAALFAVVTHAQRFPSRQGIDIPDRTDAGDFYGTWYFVMRDAKVAIWIQEKKGQPKVKLQYLNTGTAESFATDWSGHADYIFGNKTGEFDFEILESDENTIRVHWVWHLGIGMVRRTETAWIRVFRAGDGRALVLDFEDLERVDAGVSGSYLAYPQIWVFRKASKNQRRWEELPF